MKFAVETYALFKFFGVKKTLDLIKKAEFDAIDFSYYALDEKSTDNILGEDYKNFAHKIKEYLCENGLVCNQAHAPYEVDESDNFDLTNQRFKRLVNSLESASILGAKNITVHAVSNDFEINYNFYKSLEKYCEKFQICVSVENLWTENFGVERLGTPESLNRLVEKLDSKYFNICLDLGHAELTYGSAEQFILNVNKEKFKAIHIHDTLNEDNHYLPFLGKQNWDGIVKSLREVGYSGDLTFEIFGYLLNLCHNEETALNALKLANSVGKVLISKFEKLV